jgi:hypothetical protein
MHPQPYLYPVTLSVGYAVVCERCQATIGVTATPAVVAKVIAGHTCTTTPREVVR